MYEPYSLLLIYSKSWITLLSDRSFSIQGVSSLLKSPPPEGTRLYSGPKHFVGLLAGL